MPPRVASRTQSLVRQQVSGSRHAGLRSQDSYDIYRRQKAIPESRDLSAGRRVVLEIERPPQASDNWWSQRPHNNANSAHPVYTSQLYSVNPRTFFALEQVIRLARLVHCG
jgi:hypothetical protein